MYLLLILFLLSIYYGWLLPTIIIWALGILGGTVSWLQAFAIVVVLYVFGTVIRE